MPLDLLRQIAAAHLVRNSEAFLSLSNLDKFFGNI